VSELQQAFENLTTDLQAHADPERAVGMAAYMKDNFEYLGLSSPVRKQLQKPLIRASRHCGPDEILDIADECWRQDFREFQYVAMDLLRARSKLLRKDDLPRLRHFIETKSWWDSVDALSSHPLGTLVRVHDLGHVMDQWIDDENMWVARAAIYHQLRYKSDTEPDRLFDYAVKRASDSRFFIRKALGTALRQYAWTEPDRVRRFVDDHEDLLSGLTKREARKHLN